MTAAAQLVNRIALQASLWVFWASRWPSVFVEVEDENIEISQRTYSRNFLDCHPKSAGLLTDRWEQLSEWREQLSERRLQFRSGRRE
jgi:hypothetical protein